MYVAMAPGNYSLASYHDGRNVPVEGSAAFVYRRHKGSTQSAAAASSGEAEGTSPVESPYTYPAYVAIQFMRGGDKINVS